MARRHPSSRLALLLLFLSACAREGAPPAQPSESERASVGEEPDRRVLVIGIDGVRPDVLAEVSTPHLDALAAEGTFTDSARTGRPSVSGPGWSSMLTGVWPDKHGVTNNDFTGRHYDLFPDFLTRIEAARPELGTFAVVDWAPLGRLEGGMPTISDRVDVRHVLDGYELGWAEADDSSVAVAVEHLSSADPSALFVYLGNPDEVSHEHESIGTEYREAIARADAHVGRLVAAVRSRPTWEREDWLFLVSTDHGRTADGDHGGDSPEETAIFYIASGPAAARGAPVGPVHIVDVAVTALAHMGIEADPSWRLDGRVVGLRR